MADVGLDGDEAALDIRDLRCLLDCLRLVRRTAMQTAVRMITTGVMLALLAGIAIKLTATRAGIETVHMIRKGQLAQKGSPAFKQFADLAAWLRAAKAVLQPNGNFATGPSESPEFLHSPLHIRLKPLPNGPSAVASLVSKPGWKAGMKNQEITAAMVLPAGAASHLA